jgi:hypothetical protein|tara:strand:+ start:917 stop:1132 length:216 start_codon:yes stop_codon:yes gene_type:complete
MTETKTNIINIHDKKYDASDLSQEQTYFIQQIQECQTEAASLKRNIDRILIAQNTYTTSLINSLKDKEVKE